MYLSSDRVVYYTIFTYHTIECYEPWNGLIILFWVYNLGKNISFIREY